MRDSKTVSISEKLKNGHVWSKVFILSPKRFNIFNHVLQIPAVQLVNKEDKIESIIENTARGVEQINFDKRAPKYCSSVQCVNIPLKIIHTVDTQEDKTWQNVKKGVKKISHIVMNAVSVAKNENL